MSEENFFIPFEEKQIADFKEHLEKPNNHKILFSAKFGEGKTTFLKKFFENNEKYEVFHLYPINYQISSNEDIIELLKYDILIELLNKNKHIFQKNNFSCCYMFCLWITSWSTLRKIFLTGTSYFEKLGKPAKDIFGLGEDFWNFSQNLESGDKGYVEKFLEKIKQKKIEESDILSELIKDKIKKFNKQSVLILDDLDRMDPEHIFRILNIFSAHFEQSNNNKFGFNEIILVAHYGNLKEMFKHRYGEKVDEKGYFNKFFSKNIYRFDNRMIVVNAVEEMMKILKVENDPEIRYIFNFFLVRILINNLFELNKDKKLDIRIFKNAFDTEVKYSLVDLTEKDYFYYVNLCLRIMENVFIQFDKTQNLDGKEVIIDDNDNLIRKMKDKNIKIDVVNEDGSEMSGILKLIHQFSLKRYSYNNPKNNNSAHKNQDAIRRMRIDDLREILANYLSDKKHLKS